MAAYERRGAELELRWADLADSDGAPAMSRAAARGKSHAQQGAKQLWEVLTRTADVLERSAQLAEEHAQRREAAAQGEDAAHERRVADQTREAAQRARSHAEEWLQVSEAALPKVHRPAPADSSAETAR